LIVKSAFIMKKARVFLSAFAIVALVGSAFALKAHNFGGGNVFCLAAGSVTETCPSGSLKDIIVDPNGSSANPCPNTLTQTPHVQNGTQCQDVLGVDKFSASIPGK
jgi:hypothetical protein